ncbi:MAG: ABC transporter permease subunit [Clostridia bacterium]|nr:ABC transporter permease subunit [Clostridia bacterium]
MKKSKKDKILNLTVLLITVAAIFVFWTVAAVSVNSKFVLPDVPATFSAVFELLGKGSFYVALGGTLLRAVIAFAISFIIAFLLALLTEKYVRIRYAVRPLIAIMRALPTVAVVLLILFWANSKVAPVIVTMTVVLPTVYTNCVEAFSQVDGQTITALKLFKVSKKDILFRVSLPQMTPSLLYAAGAGLSLNLKLMVAAEVLASTAKSLGNLLNYYNYNIMTAYMLAVVLITVVMGLLVEGVFGFLSKKAGKWQ